MIHEIILFLLLILILKKKISNVWIIISMFSLLIFISKTNISEFFSDTCPKNERECYTKHSCGWCIDKNYNGTCIPGKKKGPKHDKHKCKNWFYRNKCIFGKQCKDSKKYGHERDKHKHKKKHQHKHKKSKKTNKHDYEKYWEEMLEEEECKEIKPKNRVP